METETTQNNHTINSPTLFMALELSNTKWRLGFTIGLGQPPRLRKLEAGNLDGLIKEIQLSKKALWFASSSSGDELLRSWARRILAASLSERSRSTESRG